MSDRSSSLRIGVVASRGRRSPGTGRHFGPFHLARIGRATGRVVAVGYLRFDRADLEALREKGIRLKVTTVGALRLGPDVSPALAQSVFGQMRTVGWRIGDTRTLDAL